MKKSALKLAFVATAFASTSVMAATNPAAAGLTSSGTEVISITKGNLVRISQLNDIVFPATAVMALGPNTLGDATCVFSTTGSYNILASSPNASGAQLRMAAGGNFLPYSLTFTDAGGSQPVTHGVTSATFLFADTASDTCFGGTNSSVDATIDGLTFNGVPQGAYSDTVTLLFSPM